MLKYSERIKTLLKIAVHEELLPLSLEEDLKNYGDDALFFNLLGFLKIIYEKSNGKLDIYGTPEEMLENLQKVENTPKLTYFFMRKGVETPNICAMYSTRLIHYDSSDEFNHESKQDAFMDFKRYWKIISTGPSLYYLSRSLYENWLNVFVNRTLKSLEESYELIPVLSFYDNNVRSEFDEFFKSMDERELVIPSGTITIDSFFDMLPCIDDEEKTEIFGELVQETKYFPMDSDQEKYKEIYAEFTLLIKESEAIIERHAGLFRPFSKLKKPSEYQKPIIRRMRSKYFDFYLNKEVETSLDLIIKTHFPERELPKDLINLENEDERKLGMVYGMAPNSLHEILEKHKIPLELFVIIDFAIEEDTRGITFPTISAYGTHCIPAIDALDKIIYYLTAILKAFERGNRRKIIIDFAIEEDTRGITFPTISAYGTHCIPAIDALDKIIYYLTVILKVFERGNRRKIVEWINDVVELLFVEKPVFYLVEIWKIDEIIDRARKELSDLLNEEDDSPPQATYSETEVLRELERITKNLGMAPRYFSELAARIISDQPMNIKTIYDGCAQIARTHLVNLNKELTKFAKSQSVFENGTSRWEFGWEYESERRNQQLEGELEKMREELKASKNANNLLKETLKRNELELEKLRETSQNAELLMSENAVLRAENFKFADLQQKSKKHRTSLKIKHSELVDSASSRSIRLSSRYPESHDVNETKKDILRIEECLVEYLENVEKEYQQLFE